jgi:hypothetical protein
VKRTTILLLGLGLIVLAVAGRPGMDERAPMDSARSVPPKRRLEWMHERGIEMPGSAGMPESDSGLTLVGKWGRGPAAEDTGKDTLVVLTLGSEVALLSFAEPDSPRVLSEIQFPSLTAQSCLVDSLLYASSNADLEVWNVADPTQPVKRGELLGPVGDFWIRDTFLFYIRRDTFHSVSIANPANLYELGSCAEAGSATTGSGNTVVVCQSAGFALVDVSNPANPHEVGFYPCGYALSAVARGSLVCASFEETSYPYPVRFITLDISDPANPYQLGRLNDAGGFDIFLDSSLAFVSGRGPGVENPQSFQILSIADSTHPALINTSHTTDRYNWGVWASRTMNRALVANDYDGLAVVDINNINSPVLDTHVVVAASAEDVSIDGHYCYVADGVAGLRILDVTDPTRPSEIGAIDTTYEGMSSYAVAARDSFAYLTWSYPYFRSVDVSNPGSPRMAGACYPPEGRPRDMALRDSFVYCAEDYQFQVVNVARPREPVVVGTCALPERSREVILSDTLAYVATLAGAVVVSIARPQNPYVIGSWPRDAMGIDLHDTILYAVTYSNSTEDALLSLSVANPAAPYVLDSVILPRTMHDVLVVDTIAYVGGWEMRLVSVADPFNLRLLDERWVPPSLYIRRLVYEPPYIYVTATDGGVCVMETLQTGVAEPVELRTPAAGISVTPSVIRRFIKVRAVGEEQPLALAVRDVMGNQVTARLSRTGGLYLVDLQNVPAGVYLVCAKTAAGTQAVKVVKTRR